MYSVPLTWSHLLRKRWSDFLNSLTAFSCAESFPGHMAGSPQESILDEWVFGNARDLFHL